jgi:hypothetical protein
MRFQHGEIPGAPLFAATAEAGACDDAAAAVAGSTAAHAAAEALHLSGPVIGVLLDCGCNGAAGAGDGVIEIGPEHDVPSAVFRTVPHAQDPGRVADVWPLSLALLDDAFGGDAPFEDLALFGCVPMASIVGARLARRAGRRSGRLGVRHYFEAVGAIACHVDRREPAILSPQAWNALADPSERGRYRYEISRATRPWEIDLRGAVRDVVFEVLGGEGPSIVSARLQNTIAAALGDIVRAVGGARGHTQVLLAGSCFRGGPLAGRLTSELVPDFEVVLEP